MVSTAFLRWVATIPPVRVIRCDCGFEVSEDGDDALVTRAQDHARRVHGMDLPAELLLALASTLRPQNTEEDGG